MTIREILAQAIVLNELGGRLDLAYRFSDADGVRSGKSGWSFGRVQYDLSNNHQASLCLAECGFTAEELAGLKAQTLNGERMAALNARLRSDHCQAVIDRWDNLQLDECIRHTRQVVSNTGITLVGDETFIHLADYHNQFYLTFGGKCAQYLWKLQHPVTPEDVRDYKLQTLWGQKRPDDVHRRWLNIHRICERTIR